MKKFLLLFQSFPAGGKGAWLKPENLTYDSESGVEQSNLVSVFLHLVKPRRYKTLPSNVMSGFCHKFSFFPDCFLGRKSNEQLRPKFHLREACGRRTFDWPEGVFLSVLVRLLKCRSKLTFPGIRVGSPDLR